MIIHGHIGPWVEFEYGIEGTFDIRTHRIQYVSDEGLEDRLKLAAAIKSGCSKDNVKILNVFRVID